MKTFPLIAFDLDGTLANTESLAIPSAVKLLNEHYNIPITVEYYYQHLRGSAGQALMDAIAKKFKKRIDIKDYIHQRSLRMEGVFAVGIQPAPGMLQALRNLAANGSQLCICSNSTPVRIKLVLQNVTGQHSSGINLVNMFEGHMFSAVGDGSGNAKPAPDVYLQASKHYGVNPAQCLAVEDTPVGVKSAVAAGFTTIAYTGLLENPEEESPKLLAAGTTHILPHWDQFLPLLENLS